MNRRVDDERRPGKHLKRSIPAILAMVLVATLCVGGTLAYFTRESAVSAQLSFDANSTEVEILNSWNEKNGAGTGDGLQRGERVNDTVSARNVGSEACYLRIRARITQGTVSATTADGKVDPAQLKELPSPSVDDLNAIVGTLYSDPNFRISSDALAAGLQPTLFTPLFGALGTPNVLSRDAATYTRTYLTSLRTDTTSGPNYGYVANSLNDYGAARSYVSNGIVFETAVSDDDVRRAAAYDTRLGRSAIAGSASAYYNVSTRAEYENGLLTFEYRGSTGTGLLDSTAITNRPLVTTICIPFDYSAAPSGGKDASGDSIGYTISFWAESVPASDFANAASTDESKRLLAMDRLDSIYPATNYYPTTNAS